MAEEDPRRQRVVVKVNFPAYPLRASLGPLGRKWALLVLMNIALARAQRFNELLRSAPGLNRRTLALRLAELERSGFIARAERSLKFTRWEVTPKGADVLPVLLTLIQFGSKWPDRSGSPEGRGSPLGVSFDVSYHAGPPPQASGTDVAARRAPPPRPDPRGVRRATGPRARARPRRPPDGARRAR